MPLDNAYFIKDLDPSNPVGTIDKVSLLDDVIREVKGCIVNTFPDMDGEVKYSTDELNDMKKNFVLEDGEWDFKGNYITNVASVKDALNAGDDKDEEEELGSDVVYNRADNDKRYLRAANNLSDITDSSEAFDNLFKEVDYTSEGMKSFKIVMTNLMYPVGSLYINVQTDQNPTEYLGVGTWVRFAEGRALIGTGKLMIDEVEKEWKAGNVAGSYVHKLTEKEMPAHTHEFEFLQTKGPGPDTKHDFKIAQHDMTSYNTKSAGGGEPHNIMQPSIAVHIWRRTE